MHNEPLLMDTKEEIVELCPGRWRSGRKTTYLVLCTTLLRSLICPHRISTTKALLISPSCFPSLNIFHDTRFPKRSTLLVRKGGGERKGEGKPTFVIVPSTRTQGKQRRERALNAGLLVWPLSQPRAIGVLPVLVLRAFEKVENSTYKKSANTNRLSFDLKKKSILAGC